MGPTRWHDGPINNSRAREVMIQLKELNRELNSENYHLKSQNIALRFEIQSVGAHNQSDDLYSEIVVLKAEVEAMQRKLITRNADMEKCVYKNKQYKSEIVFLFVLFMIFYIQDYEIGHHHVGKLALPMN
ncbi:AciNPV44 [Corchorus olitorius]|uniref:AciNPV44 n=1 Tax=Corchorus olitorius TaxID=93759 RepID=A0A1R3GNA9_9ROSI|nr:AciNPV44 [Corchorus olitorius]